MSEPRESAPSERTENLTTEQLANAGAATRTTAEPRAFEDEDRARSDASSGPNNEPLLPRGEADEFRASWDSIQAGFVDEPRRAVEDADHLVAQAMKRLAEMFAEERGRLESQWDRGDDVSTEDLRVALQRYRAFFGRLLSV